jgi:hypothetical protein
MDEQKNERIALRAKARRWLQMLYFCFVVVVVGVIVVEITTQAASEPFRGPEQVQCEPEILALWSAVERARTASCKTELEEEQAVAAFQTALQPEWGRAGAIRRACGKNSAHLETLDAIQYLRFAEENTVRRESSELAYLRRRARELLDRNIREASGPP